MPYQSIQDLPDQVTAHTPKHAQEIYKEAFNNAWQQYKDPDKRRTDEDREQIAHKVAWSAVKQEYEKGDDGQWHAKQTRH